MFATIVATLFLGVPYPPPTEYDVLNLLQKRSTVGAEETFVDPYDQVENYELGFSSYPIDVILRHCDPFENDSKRYGFRSIQYDRGYRCLVQVISNATAPYDLSGIFTHDGLQWRYYGYNLPRGIRPQETINRKNVSSGRFILKPGSVPYDGNPENPINDVRSPYRDLFLDGMRFPN